MFWPWPCSPQIRDAVDQLKFVFPIHASNNIIFILCAIFDPVPGGKVAIQSLVKIIEVLIPIIIWRKFGQMLLPAPGWHLLKLKIDKWKTEVAFFDCGLAVSHWIDSVCRLCRCCCYLFCISICRIIQRSWTGRGAFVLEAWCNWEQEFYYEILMLLLDFRQRLLISCCIFDKGF